MSSKLNITEEFQKISEKLTKKMFYKTNYSTLTDQFEKLGTNLKRSEQLHYTAFCLMAAAKCEEENKTPINGANFFSNAGRIFLTTAVEEDEIHYFSAEEFIIEGIRAFQKSIEIYSNAKEYGLASSLSFEIGNFLKVLRKYEEATNFFLQSSMNDEKLNHKTSNIISLKQAVECSIKTKDFDVILENLTKLLNAQNEKRKGGFLNIDDEYIDTYISLYLVLLIQKEKNSSFETLEKISSFCESLCSRSILHFNENYLPMLYELYENCVDNKPQYLELFESDLFEFFNEQHCQLFTFLKYVYKNPLYLSTVSTLKE
eukprot:gene7168-11480_t